MPCRDDKKNAAGITLVEVAVVMIVVGILIAGVVKGAEMWRQSRITATYAQMEAVSRSLQVFIDKYRALPGDMPDAVDRLANCTDTPAGSCRGGNGDGMIGPGNQAVHDAPAAGADEESLLFWQHLQAAGLLNAVNPAALTAAPSWGGTNPAAAAAGGLRIRTLTGNTEDLPGRRLVGIYIVWQQTPVGAANAPGNFVLSPLDAAALDRRMDDGAPLDGYLRGRGSDTGVAADECRASSIAYLAGAEDLGCYMYFRIRGVSGL